VERRVGDLEEVEMAIRRPEEFAHHEAQLPDVKVHYVREGSGPPLLLVHGWPGFWWEWHKVVGELARDFDVIVPDLRGYGDSEKPDLRDISKFHLNLATEDQANLLKHLGIEQAFVVGHDYSAIIMHKFVRKHRGMTRAALIINPIVPGFEGLYLSVGHFPQSWYSQFHQLDMAVELVSSSREACRIYYRHFFNQWSYRDQLLTPEELEIYVDNFMKPGNIHGGFNYYRANLSITSQPWTALDRTISDAPVTFLWGMGDTVVPSTGSDMVTNWYNNYTIEYFPDSGHFMMVETPEVVIDRIRRAFVGAKAPAATG
jgi:pimeloyl-ACP methyl ester carboxylesterase